MALVKELAKKGQRISRRACEEPRLIQLQWFENVLCVRSGPLPNNSCVYFSFTKQKTKPYPDKPSEGIFHISLERGRKNDSLLNFLHNVYIKSRCICTSDLCLRFNQEVYSVAIEIYPVQAQGDLFRLCMEGINEIIKRLEIKTYFKPEIIQVGEIEGVMMHDLEDAELQASGWTVNVVMKSTRELLLVEKTGEGIESDEILKVVDYAMSTVKNKKFL